MINESNAIWSAYLINEGKEDTIKFLSSKGITAPSEIQYYLAPFSTDQIKVAWAKWIDSGAATPAQNCDILREYRENKVTEKLSDSVKRTFENFVNLVHGAAQQTH